MNIITIDGTGEFNNANAQEKEKYYDKTYPLLN